MLYEWTDLHFLNRSDLHAQVMKRKLAPELSKFLKIASKELDYGWNLDVPQTQGKSSNAIACLFNCLTSIRLCRGRYSAGRTDAGCPHVSKNVYRRTSMS